MRIISQELMMVITVNYQVHFQHLTTNLADLVLDALDCKY